MWPWSTIKRFKIALSEMTAERDMWEAAYHRAGARLDEGLRLFDEAKVHFDQNREAVVRLTEDTEQAAREKKALMAYISTLSTEINVLRMCQNQMVKNDARDPKTGRFISSLSGAKQ